MYSKILITWVLLDKLNNILVFLEGRFFFLVVWDVPSFCSCVHFYSIQNSECSSIPVKMCNDLKLYQLLLITFNNVYYVCI